MGEIYGMLIIAKLLKKWIISTLMGHSSQKVVVYLG